MLRNPDISPLEAEQINNQMVRIHAYLFYSTKKHPKIDVF